ncbi:MAG: phosphatase PAP2 family protein [Oscillospiraceae bacterium]|nr:phosphatase PAP2 family protein [Oscillospiraceae bacterium]
MGILYFLESIRNPVLDAFFSFITEFGGETFFLGAALFLYWCVDKRQGYYLMAVGFLGTLANQFLKLTCRVPRPWVRDPNFTIVESAREGASGYSFPSGHSQTSVGTFGVIARENRNKWVRSLATALCVLVPLSRMYLGVHFLSDVLVGSGMALGFIALLRPVVYGKDGKYIPAMFGVMVLLALLFLAYTELWPFPADIDPHNLESAVKNSYTLLGSLLGMIAAYYADQRWLRFPTEAPQNAQAVKVAVGAMLVLGVKAGLKAPLEALFGGHMVSRAVRYFLVVIVAGVIWPMTFRWFAGWGKKER